MNNSFSPNLFIIPIIILIIFIGLIFSFWRKVAADKALVITGFKKRVLTGKGGFLIPFFETSCEISLENISMTTDVQKAPSQQGIFVDVTGTAVVKVDNNVESINKAVEQFCSKNATNTTNVIREMVEPVLEGRLRGIVSTMTVEQINNDRSAFETKIEQDITKELEEMGLKLISYSILEIKTQGGYLENRARPQVAASKSEAEIAESLRKRDTDIKTAEAEREGKKAKLEADTQIAEAVKEKELKLYQYQIEQDKSKAEADAAYNLRKIEQDTEISRRAAIKEEQEAIKKEKELIVTVRKPAEAEKGRKIIEAEAEKETFIRQAEAEAESLKINAQAEADSIKLKAIAEAEAIKIKGNAEADVIKAKGLAEAEAKASLAESYSKYGNAAIAEMAIKNMPLIMSEIVKPMSNIDKITVIDSGSNDSSAACKIPNTVTNIAGMGFETLNSIAGINIPDIIQQFSNKNKLQNDINTPITDAKIVE